MALDWDIILIDNLGSIMCSGCKFEKECFPKGSDSNMELRNLAQMTICMEGNVKNTFRPEELYYTN